MFDRDIAVFQPLISKPRQYFRKFWVFLTAIQIFYLTVIMCTNNLFNSDRAGLVSLFGPRAAVAVPRMICTKISGQSLICFRLFLFNYCELTFCVIRN